MVYIYQIANVQLQINDKYRNGQFDLLKNQTQTL